MREGGAHETHKITTPPMSKTNKPMIDNQKTNLTNAPGGPPEPKMARKQKLQRKKKKRKEQEEEEERNEGEKRKKRKPKESGGGTDEEEEEGAEKWNFYLKIDFKIQTCLFT